MKLLLPFILQTITATFTNCAHGKQGFLIGDVSANPSDSITANQHATFNITFTIPPTAYIPSASVSIRTYINGFPAYTEERPYGGSLLPNTYTHLERFQFPVGIWGHVRTDIVLRNTSGTQLLCARWIVFATPFSSREL